MQPLRSLYASDPGMAEIVQEFACALGGRARELGEAHARGDLEALGTLAHQLKGAGGGYGFPQISEAAAAVEQAVREYRDPSALQTRLESLYEVLRAAALSEGH